MLDPAPSQRVRNHSPDGFNWGYGGSGPAQLALALLLDHFNGDSHRASRYYQRFKFAVVAGLDIDGDWTLTEEDIQKALAQIITEESITHARTAAVGGADVGQARRHHFHYSIKGVRDRSGKC